MKIEQWPVDKLIPYPRNARKIPQSAVDKVAASIREFGWQQPIVVDSDRVVVAGHTRLLAAKQLEEKKVPVTVASGLTPGQIKAFRLMDNRSHQESGWDFELLGPELLELQGLDIDVGLSGFDAEEIATFFQGAAAPDDSPADETPALQEVVFTSPGDLWLLGKHRLLCGDCRDAAAIQRLFEGTKANVVVTSPPYASQRKYDESSGFRPIPPDQYTEWYRTVAANVATILASDGSYFLNIKEHADEGERSLYVKDLVLAHKRTWGWRFVDELCWRNTANGVPGTWPNRFKNAWEPVFHFARQKEIKFHPLSAGHESKQTFEYSPAHPESKSGSGLLGSGHKRTAASGSGLRPMPHGENPEFARPSNVIEVRAESGQGDHTAPFPRALVEFFVKAFSDTGDLVFDPFMGSGTTLIAAQNLERTGYGTEISPGYCDVIVRRYEAFTGKKAKLEDGRTLNQLEAAKAVAA